MQRVLGVIIVLGSWCLGYAQTYSLLLAQKVQQVTEVNQQLLDYENFGPKPTGSLELELVNDWLVSYYTDLGYTVSLDSFKVGSLLTSNIIIEKHGKDTTQWVVIGAHYDSVVDSYGANDNGTGVVATMQIARLIRDIPTQLSVRIINFGAEELGLLGSEHYVANTLSASDSIAVMFNLDQLGGTKSADNSKIVCERDEGNRIAQNDLPSARKTDTLAHIFTQYTHLKPVLGSAFSTDYMPFEERGYTITGLYQESDYNAFYHSSSDRLFNMDTEATKEVIKGTVAASIYFARPLVADTEQDLITLVPNPARNFVRVIVTDYTEVNYVITNALGQQVATGLTTVGEPIPIHVCGDGLYTVSIYTTDDVFINASKLIIAR
ncbi:M28 family peptidase [Bacteroidia bacterium]|nr:M28 family peptidase [Bacteroidia bacterium]